MRNRIGEWRQARGLTQEQLAEAADTHFTTINRLENGKQGLSEKWIRKLSDVLEVHPADLLAEGSPPVGVLKEETEIYVPAKSHWTANAQLADHQCFYRIQSDALSAIDIPKGAIVIADFSADAVAQARENTMMTVPVLIHFHHDPSDFSRYLTLPRQFVPPHLVIRNSLDKSPDPIALGDGRADMVAVLASVIRNI